MHPSTPALTLVTPTDPLIVVDDGGGLQPPSDPDGDLVVQDPAHGAVDHGVRDCWDFNKQNPPNNILYVLTRQMIKIDDTHLKWKLSKLK